MWLISFAFAWMAFILASNIFDKFWKWLVTAAITFIVFSLIIAYELYTLLCIVVGILVAIMIALLIKKNFFE